MIHLGNGLNLPPTVITERVAFLAKSGAGKTYAAGVLAEEMLKRGHQIVVLDPVAKWWGLRLKADGVTKAFQIPVFGGKHGDLPLAPTAGKVCAHAVVEHGTSAVFDLILFETEGDKRRFVADFCRELFRLKSQEDSPRPLHVFLEEAEEFMPQTWESADAQMIGAVKRLFKLGRNFGIGGSLISQRSAGVNKQALSQVEYLVALRTKAGTDIKAVREWIEYAAGKATADEVVESISTLAIGEAWLVGGEADPKRGRIKAKTTLDTSGTPKGVAKKIETPKLSEKDLQQLRDAIGAAVEEADASNVRKLRLRIVELEKALAQAPAKVEKATPVPSKLIQRIEAAIKRAEKLQAAVSDRGLQLDKLSDSWLQSSQVIGQLLAETARALKPDSGSVGLARPAGREIQAPNGKSAIQEPRHSRPETHHVPHDDDGDGIGKGPQAILDALATFHPKPLTRTQVGVMTGYKPNGSTMRAYLGRLRGAKLINGAATLSLTEEGRRQAGPARSPITSSELIAFWCDKLGSGPAAILRRLADIYPDGTDREDLQKHTGYEANGSTMRAYLGRLRGTELIVKRDGDLFASDALFPGG